MPRLEDFVLDIITVTAADPHPRHSAIVAAEPSVRVVCALIPHIRKVVPIVRPTPRVHNHSVAFVPEGALVCVVVRAGRWTSVAVFEKVRRKVKVVEIPRHGRRRLFDVASSLVVVEAAEADAQQWRQSCKGNGLHGAGVAAALVAREVVECVVGNVLVQRLLKSLPCASQRNRGWNPFKRRKGISLGVAILALDRREFQASPVPVDDGVVVLYVVVPVLNGGVEQRLRLGVWLHCVALEISTRVGFIMQLFHEERHELLRILLLRSTELGV